MTEQSSSSGIGVQKLAEPAPVWSRAYMSNQLERAILNPIRSMRLAYLPLLMVYFSYGAMGLIAVAQAFWIKSALTLTPVELAGLAVWLNIPWTVKMVFGELVDSVSLFGSRRRGYVFVGGGMVACGLLVLAGTASQTIRFIPATQLYALAALMIVIGLVLQDVVADAMSTEVVPRIDSGGQPRLQADIDRDLGMVQILGRLALSLGVFVTAGLGGWLAAMLPYATVFLLALLVPLISVSGAMLVHLETPEVRPVDWRMLTGGLAFGCFVVITGLSNLSFGQEIVFAVSLIVIVGMLRHVVRDADPSTQRQIFYVALLIFLFRSSPSVGQGYGWFAIDRLGFDEAFQGTLGQIGAAIPLIVIWLFSDAITRLPVTRVLLWLALLGAIVALPGLGLTLGLHEWTSQNLGFGARAIALVDAAVASPLALLGTIPMLTLIAIHAPAGHRAIWFALMASLMNLALSAAELQTKYLNLLFPVDRGQYANLPTLYASALLIGVCVPLISILTVGRRIR